MQDDINQLDDHKVHENEPGRTDGAMSAIVLSMTGIPDIPADPATEPADPLVGMLEAVQAKDRSAFEALYDATVQRTFSLAVRITRQQVLAEEVVSDVYLQVWQQAGSYSPTRGTVMAWLGVLCRSRALDAIRRDNTAIRKAQVGLDAVPEQEDSREPSDLLQSVEQGTAIHAALGELTEQQRQLVALAYFRGYTHSELAIITNMPIGTVKTHLHRSMIKMKEIMSDVTEITGGSDE